MPLAPLLVAVLMLAADPAPATHGLCPTCPMRVSERSPTVAVRGRPYRVCCVDRGKDMQTNPDKYLEKDGTPKNAKPK